MTTGGASGAQQDAHDDGVPPRGSLALVLDGRFGPFFAGKFAGAMAQWIHNIVCVVSVYQLTESATMVGAVTIFQFVPQVLFAPLLGAVADRGDRRAIATFGRLLAALPGTVMCIWIWAVGLEGLPGAWVILVVAGVSGVALAITIPAMQAVVPALVPRRDLPAALALDALPFPVARAIGPALGALLIVAGGPALAFAASGACNLLFGIVLLRIKPDVQERKGSDRSVRGGFRYLRGDPISVLLLLGAVAVGIGVDPVVTLTPPVAAELGGGDTLVGILASAFGVGAAAAVLVSGWLRKRYALTAIAPAGVLILGAGMVALALATTPLMAIVAMAVGGVGMLVAQPALTTQLQQRIPEEMRGRIMALWSVCFLGSRPLAAAMNGVLTDLFSVDVALYATTAILVLTALLLIRGPKDPAHRSGAGAR